MIDLDGVRQLWLRDREKYEKFSELLEVRIRGIVKAKGYWSRVTSRTKQVDSLLRKLLRDASLRYEKLWDLTGVRVVVRFQEEVRAVTALIEDAFDVLKKKEFALRPDQTGYQGTHCIVALKTDDPDRSKYESCVAEVQIRTISQDLWAEMAHELSYKAVISVPPDIERRVNILSGLVEMADNEFSRLNREIADLPGVPELKILEALQRQFWKLSARAWDKALSVEVIKVLRTLYKDMPPGEWALYFERFYDQRKADLESILDEQRELPNRSLFLFQPEVLMIFDRLSVDPDALQHVWNQHFPQRELEKLATLWGVSLE